MLTDGRAASVSQGLLLIWDPEHPNTSLHKGAIIEHPYAGGQVTMLEDDIDGVLITASSTGGLCVWDTHTLELESRAPECRYLASLSSNDLVVIDDGVAISEGAEIQVWDINY